MEGGEVILSLAFEDDEHLNVGVNKDAKILANGIYSFLSMCSNEDLGEYGKEALRGFLLGVGEWLGSRPTKESAFVMAFLNKCITGDNERILGQNKGDC